MRFRVLGPLEALDAAGDPLALTGAKERTLLAALLVTSGNMVSTDRLIEILWPDQPPANPANALQARVSALRRSLGDPGVIASQPPGYRIAVSQEEVDSIRFERLLNEARRPGSASAAVEVYDRALALWRGDPFPEFAYQEFALPEILRLEEMFVSAKEERIQLLLDLGRHAEALAELEGLVIDHPFRERLRGQLMLALYRSGRQADALRAFADAARTLGEELGIEPSVELRELEEAILVQDPSIAGPKHIAPPRPHNLPARLTSLVGRSEDVARVVDLLSEYRLLTLTGPGGVGKTSLAVACGQELVGRFGDGVWLVELAAIADPALVPIEIARSLSLDISDRPTLELICEVVAERRLLLVVDNCEHLIDAAAGAIATLLQRSPELRVIATSREPLGVPGEILWPTRPLGTPSETATGIDVESYDSVRLFAERASAVYPEFELNPETIPNVVDICRRLDGLPLALELAAARVHNLPVNEIASRLDDRFRLLTTGRRTVLPRQMTLEATISWSYELLTDEERELFRRMAAFSGGWTVEAAVAVSPHVGDVSDLLSRLVDRSLLNVDRSSAVSRFSMLETIREFAIRELEASEDRDETVGLHAGWFLDLAESARFQGPDQAQWEQALSAEFENLRVALLRSLETADAATALRLGSALGWWWFFGNRDEGRALLDHLLDATADHDLNERVLTLLARARLDLFGPTPRSLAAAREALELADRHGDAEGAARAKTYVALDSTTDRPVALLDEAIAFFATDGKPWDEALARFLRMEALAHEGDLTTAIEEGETALSLFRNTGDPWAISAALAHLAKFGRLTGRVDWAGEVSEEALEVSRRRNLPHTVQYVLTHQAYLALLIETPGTARELLAEAMTIAADVGNQVGVATILNGLAECHVAGGNFEDAGKLHADALHRFEALSLAADVSYSLTRLGLASELAGDPGTARAHHRDGMAKAAEHGDAVALVPCLEGMGRCAIALGDTNDGGRLLAAGLALRARLGLAPLPAEAMANLAAENRMVEGMSPEDKTALWEEMNQREVAALVSIARQPVG